MKWTEISYIKQHSRIDFDCEDAVLELYANAAEETVLNYLGIPYQELISEYGGVPDAIRQATLMLIDVSYSNRSPISPTNVSIVPYTFDILVKPYMRLAGGVEQDVTSIPLGDETKIEFTTELPDGLKLSDVEFTGKIMNADAKDKVIDFTKGDCIMVDDGESYVVLVDTEDLGVGSLLMKLTVQIPDTDFPKGYRRSVVNINPQINIVG